MIPKWLLEHHRQPHPQLTRFLYLALHSLYRLCLFLPHLFCLPGCRRLLGSGASGLRKAKHFQHRLVWVDGHLEVVVFLRFHRVLPLFVGGGLVTEEVEEAMAMAFNPLQELV